MRACNTSWFIITEFARRGRRKILVCVEMTDVSRHAALEATRIAVATGAPVHLLMAVDKAWSRTITGGGTEAWNVDWLTTAEQFLDDLIRELSNKNVIRAVIVGGTAKTARAEAASGDALL
jgi:nucleotide-binding universal stress UspA family protein